MPNSFDKVKDKFGNNPMVIVVFLASVAMLAIGSWHFAEDTYSSYLGLISVQSVLNMKVQIFNWTYWTMSFAPQIASIVFFFMYLSTGDKKYLWGSIVSQGVDFMADSWYRSNGQLFGNAGVTIVSFIFTFAYFTLGSEVFISIGLGLTLKLFAPALGVWKKEWNSIKAASKGQTPGGGGHDRPPSGGGKPGGHAPVRPDLAAKLGMQRRDDIQRPQMEHGMTPVDRSQMGGRNGGGGDGNNSGDTGKFPIPRGS